MLSRIVTDVRSEFWPESKTEAPKLADLRLPKMESETETVLILLGETGSHERWNVYRWVVKRYAERFLAVNDIPSNYYGHGDTDWGHGRVPCPAGELLNRRDPGPTVI